MKIGTIDSIYEAIFENNLVTVKDQNGQIIGSRSYTLNFQPRLGFDVLDQSNMEEIACNIVDEFKKEK